MLSIRIAFRNLWRHRWRTILTIGGIAVSTAVLIWLIALFVGIYAEMARGMTSVEIGQVQIRSTEYLERESIHHTFEWSSLVEEKLENTDGVEAFAPRVIVNGLVGHEEQSRISRIKGVEPDSESAVTVMERALVSGQWLSPSPAEPQQPRQVVLGAVMAKTLDVDVGDELVVLLQATDGSLGNDLLQVTGIVQTGNIAIDRHTVYMHIDDLQFIAVLDGELHEIAVATSLDGAPAVAETLRAAFADLAPDQLLSVRPWQEIATELYLMMELAEAVTWWLLAIIFAVAALGTFNTLRMSTLERRREFGVMMGVGLSRGRLMSMIVSEGVLLGIFGALVGGLAGAALAYATGYYGLSLDLLTDRDSLTFVGVAFTDRIHFEVSRRALVMPVVGILVVTGLCALWPAYRATREEPRDAIAGR